jgi:hypothetical protein
MGKLFPGLSAYDCQMAHEIVKLRAELKKETKQFNMIKSACVSEGWWAN